MLSPNGGGQEGTNRDSPTPDSDGDAATADGDWSDTEGLDAEQAIVGVVEAAVGGGLLTEIDEPPPCPYPAHRDAGDWRGRDGRLRCRVCHPPAPGAERTTP
jgi:hypothetical protein